MLTYSPVSVWKTSRARPSPTSPRRSRTLRCSSSTPAVPRAPVSRGGQHGWNDLDRQWGRASRAQCAAPSCGFVPVMTRVAIVFGLWASAGVRAGQAGTECSCSCWPPLVGRTCTSSWPACVLHAHRHDAQAHSVANTATWPIRVSFFELVSLNLPDMDPQLTRIQTTSLSCTRTSTT